MPWPNRLATGTDATKETTLVHVLNGVAFGGVEALCLQLLRHAPPHVQSVLINLNPDCQEMLPLFQQMPELEIQALPYHPRHRLGFIVKLVATLQQLQPQAVLIYPFGLHVLVGLAARLAGVPTIAVHAGNPPPSSGPSRRIWKFILVASRLLHLPIYSCSHAVEQALTELTALPAGSYPIPNGCDVAAIAQQAALSRSRRPADAGKVIGMVARLNAIKDHETLIRAFASVHATVPQTQLWLIGEGDRKAELQALVQQLNLQEAVTFWGDRADVPNLLGQMDIFVLSTTTAEGFGIALIEAMTAHLPIVATDVDACREVLGNGAAGLLVPEKNPAAIAQVLKHLLSSPEAMTVWGARAYHRAVTCYSMQTCAEAWYTVLLKQRGARSDESTIWELAQANHRSSAADAAPGSIGRITGKADLPETRDDRDTTR